MSAERPTIDVTPAPGGWMAPWPSVAELTAALPAGSWTLVGGPMTQLHTLHHGLGIVRPTNDVDIILHIGCAHPTVSRLRARRTRTAWPAVARPIPTT